jgi:hypothetical protein
MSHKSTTMLVCLYTRIAFTVHARPELVLPALACNSLLHSPVHDVGGFRAELE